MIAQDLLSLAELAEREQRPAEELQVPFAARIDGEAVEVTAVLERTAIVYASGSRHGDGRLAGHGRVFVDPALPWGPRVSEAERKAKRFNVWRLDENPDAEVVEHRCGESRTALRARSDRRALADQAKPRTVKVKVPKPSTPTAKVRAPRPPKPPRPGRACDDCGAKIRPHNTKGLCEACRRRCPLCGGRKSLTAQACITCMPPKVSGSRPRPSRRRVVWPMPAESPPCIYCGQPSPCGCASARVAAEWVASRQANS